MRRLALGGVLICGCGRFDFGARPDARSGDATSSDGSLDSADSADSADASSSRIVDLNGGASWNGWNLLGTSVTDGIWVRGATDRAYMIYTTEFVLDAAQTVTAPTLAQGDPGDGTGIIGDTGDLFAGNWQAGDHILGIGLAYGGTTTLTRMFVQFDHDPINIVPASAVGALDGAVAFDAGDTTSFWTSELGPGDRFREYQFTLFTGFTSDGSSNFSFIYGPPPLPSPPRGPSRSLAVLAPGSAQLAQSIQLLHDFEAAARVEGATPEGACTATTRVNFEEGDLISGTETSMQNFPLAMCP